MPRHRIDPEASGRLAAMIVTIGLCAISGPVSAQWQLGTSRGDTLRVGYTVQTRAEWLRAAPDAPTAQNLFLRHARLLISGKLLEPLSFFLGTDSPNLGKTLPDGTKNTAIGGVYDGWVTYAPRSAFNVDAGLIGTPNSHNSIQSIAGMLASDFGPYSFVSTPPLHARAGRDYGAQARGYLLNDHVEYRGGVFRGYRGPTGDYPFRYLTRVVVDAFRAEKSVYYSGTSLGTRKSLAFGASLDHQQRYNGLGADVYFDHPVAGRDGVTLQLDVVQYDGSTTLAGFPKQRTLLGEAGYFSQATRLAPFIQISRLDFSADSLRDQRQYLAGLAYFVRGHRLNVKAVYGSTQRSGLPRGSLFQLTIQSFEF